MSEHRATTASTVSLRCDIKRATNYQSIFPYPCTSSISQRSDAQRATTNSLPSVSLYATQRTCSRQAFLFSDFLVGVDNDFSSLSVKRQRLGM